MIRKRFLGVVTVTLATIAGCQAPSWGPGEASTSLPGEGLDTGKTVIYRDRYGIPHIYAPTVAAGLYAQGWAQAQDRPTQLLLNLKIAMGELTEVSGEDGIGPSLISHMFGHMRNAQASTAAMSADERRRITAFANGITDFYAANPQDVPEFWRHEAITPQMIDAFGRMFLYNWSIDEALGDLRRGGIDPGFVSEQRASNQWAVSPQRSASGHAILLIDPHLAWFGVSRFWEMRVHAGDWAGSGVGLAGSPYIGLGHNEDLAWAMTTGGPDTADVFQLELHPQDPNVYLYDGEWRELEQHTVDLAFPDGSTRTFTWQAAHQGPIIATADGFAYAAAIAYDSGTNRNRAWEALNFAEDYRGVEAACATLSMFPQNVMAADTSGNIYYQRTGRVPVRDPSLDWSKPVDGSTSATAWQGFHPASDHLSVLNPSAGYMQNCNIPPDAMLPDSPFHLDAQPRYLFSSAAHGPAFDGWINQRGARAVELLNNDASVTIDEALAYAVDVTPYGHRRWLNVLAISAPDDSEALAQLLEWNGQLDRDNRDALKYFYWRKQLDASDQGAAIRELIDDHYAIVEPREPKPIQLNQAQLAAVRLAWEEGLARMRKDLGTTDAPWGRVFRVGRDNVSWPVGGGGGDQLGVTTLRTMGYADANDKFERHGRHGQTSTQVVLLSKPIQSWIYLPVGQSDRPESAHYRDQAATVFSARTLKPSLWRPEDLAGHIRSREVLTPRL